MFGMCSLVSLTMEYYISFGDRKAKFIISEIHCDLSILGFIPSDKSLPISEIIPIKYVGGDRIFLKLSQTMIDSESDAVVLGDTYYLLRSFSENNQNLLALCKPVNPIFPSQAFDGKLYIKELSSFPVY